MKLILRAITLTLSLGSQVVLAHGEDKAGPNGGFIRMPGSFHTEVILTGASALKVYLLDINWKNPTVKDSVLKVTHKESKVSGVCTSESNYFICQFPKSVDLTKKGELALEAQRNGQKGMSVSYDLPLKLKKINDTHGDHH